jgi:hypothetical protein
MAGGTSERPTKAIVTVGRPPATWFHRDTARRLRWRNERSGGIEQGPGSSVALTPRRPTLLILKIERRPVVQPPSSASSSNSPPAPSSGWR